MSKTALILLNGEKPPRQILERYWEKTDFRVCADGAASTCLAYSLQPELIIGDMDSLDESSETLFPATEIIRVADQETTDSEKAIQYCIDKGYHNLYLFGALGKRLDHSLYNLGLLRHYHGQVDVMTVFSDGERAFLISGERTFTSKPGTRISLMPVFGRVDNVTAHGLDFPVENRSLELGCYSSVSNAFTETEISISVPSGFLLVVMEEGQAG